MNLKYRSAAFELKDVDSKQGVFTGYASVFGNLDSYRDVMERGAFTKTLNEFSHRVKALWQHDPMQPIGRPTVMREDDRGLYVEAKVSQTSLGKDALILLEDGVINEMSIGYTPVKDVWDREGNVRRLTEVKLWEFSLVTWAANDLALIAGVKSLDELDGSFDDLVRELKAGRMFSAANLSKMTTLLGTLEGTCEELRTLIAAGEPAGKATPCDAQPSTQTPDPEHVQSVKSLLTEMRAFAEQKRN